MHIPVISTVFATIFETVVVCLFILFYPIIWVVQKNKTPVEIPEFERLLESGFKASVNPWLRLSEEGPTDYQVELPLRSGSKMWYARIRVRRPDEEVIQDAIKLLNLVRPQKFGPYMTHIVSYWQRERLLNLLIEHYWKTGALPCGRTVLSTALDWATFSGVAYWRVEGDTVKVLEQTKVCIPLEWDFPDISSRHQRLDRGGDPTIKGGGSMP